MIEISNKWRRIEREYSIIVSDNNLEKLIKSKKFCCINWGGMRRHSSKRESVSEYRLRVEVVLPLITKRVSTDKTHLGCKGHTWDAENLNWQELLGLRNN